MFSVVSRLVVGPAAAGIERPLVERDEEDAVVVAEDRLVPLPWWTSKSTIATRSRPSSRCATRAAIGDVVEEAEAHRAFGQRVVAGRPDEREAAAERSLDRGPGRERRGLERSSRCRSCRRRATRLLGRRAPARRARRCGRGEAPPRSRARPSLQMCWCSSSTASRSGRSGMVARRVEPRERRMRQDVDRRSLHARPVARRGRRGRDRLRSRGRLRPRRCWSCEGRKGGGGVHRRDSPVEPQVLRLRREAPVGERGLERPVLPRAPPPPSSGRSRARPAACPTGRRAARSGPAPAPARRRSARAPRPGRCARSRSRRAPAGGSSRARSRAGTRRGRRWRRARRPATSCAAAARKSSAS